MQGEPAIVLCETGAILPVCGRFPPFVSDVRIREPEGGIGSSARVLPPFCYTLSPVEDSHRNAPGVGEGRSPFPRGSAPARVCGSSHPCCRVNGFGFSEKCAREYTTPRVTGPRSGLVGVKALVVRVARYAAKPISYTECVLRGWLSLLSFR